MVSNGVVREEDDVRPLWRMDIGDDEPRPAVEPRRNCRMRDSPIQLFICPRIAVCPLKCTQKEQQEGDQDFVFRQRLRMRMLVQRRMQQAGDAQRD